MKSMAIKKYKPTTPASRWRSVATFEGLTKKKPEKSLTRILKKSGGRNVYGRITVRGVGGGHKRKLRLIDFKRDKFNVPGKIIALEYDPNRSSRIALVHYQDGERRYILAPLDLKVGDEVVSSNKAELKVGNTLPLANIPPGIPVHNLELHKGKGGQIVRSAGSVAQILAKEGNYAHVRLPSGEVRLIQLGCLATIGQVGNVDHENISIGSAGRARHLGIQPTTRGVAKNPVDHPMGGGEGKSSGGRHPTTPWGKATKGLKTRKAKQSDRYIVRRRPTKEA
jgi:large subunit ribosomal protein L2